MAQMYNFKLIYTRKGEKIVFSPNLFLENQEFTYLRVSVNEIKFGIVIKC